MRRVTCAEPFRATVGQLPRRDPFAGSGFNPARLRDTPDVVRGDFGLVTREGGVLSPQQLQNAWSVLQNRCQARELKELGFSIEARQLAPPQPVHRANLTSNLPAHLARHYGRTSGPHAFMLYLLQPGTVLFDLHTDFPMSTFACVEVLHAGMIELGIACMVCPRGVVNTLDDFDSNDSLWHRYRNAFRRPQGRAPDGVDLLHVTRGHYRLGEPGRTPVAPIKVREQIKWRSAEDEEKWMRRASQAHVLDRPVRPCDVFGLSTKARQWKQRWMGQGRGSAGTPAKRIIPGR